MSSPLLSSDENYELKHMLGNGAYGVVNKIITKIDDLPLKKKARQEYALKQINLRRFKMEERQQQLEDAKQEYNVLKRKLDHIVPAYGSYHDRVNDSFIFSMEIFPKNLKTLMEMESGKFSFEQYIPIFQDIITGSLYSEFAMRNLKSYKNV